MCLDRNSTGLEISPFSIVFGLIRCIISFHYALLVFHSISFNRNIGIFGLRDWDESKVFSFFAKLSNIVDSNCNSSRKVYHPEFQSRPVITWSNRLLSVKKKHSILLPFFGIFVYTFNQTLQTGLERPFTPAVVDRILLCYFLHKLIDLK